MLPIPTRRHRPCALPSLLFMVLLAAQAQAQTPTTVLRPDPLDPKAQVPAVQYTSAFVQFRRIDDKPMAWRDANDAVARIGGWRVYAREAQQADSAVVDKPAATPAQVPAQVPASAPGAVAKPMAPGHAGHKH